MKAGTKLFLLNVLVLTCVSTAAAQSQILEIRGAGERRVATEETPELARRLALIAAGRDALRQATTRLQSSAEVKTVPLKANQLDALLPIVVDVEEEPARDDEAAIGTVVRANVFVRMNVVEIAGRLDKLRKDPHAVTAIMEMWSQAEELHQQLAGNVKSARETELLIARLHAKHLVAHVHAALAKTEESPASARVASRNGRQRAKQLAESAVVLGPDLPETHLAMGDMAIDSDQVVVAEAEYRHALLLSPASVTAHLKVADALRLGGNLPEAVKELREALRIDPNSAAAHNDLGYLLGTQQNTSESISEYKEALRLDPDFIEAHNYLAIVHARAGRIPDAVAEFREIVRIDPDSVLGYYNLGIALADMELDGESAEAFRQAVRINPNHFNARYNLGELFRLEGKFDDAVKQFREYLRLAPDIPQNQRNIGRARDFVKTHENPN